MEVYGSITTIHNLNHYGEKQTNKQKTTAKTTKQNKQNNTKQNKQKTTNKSNKQTKKWPFMGRKIFKSLRI